VGRGPHEQALTIAVATRIKMTEKTETRRQGNELDFIYFLLVDVLEIAENIDVSS
jgi:hypothetical protein